MDALKNELNPEASYKCYRNNSLNSFTNFLLEDMHLNGEWEVANPDILYLSLY